jgi:LAO/AO transport system kinase
MSEPAKDPGSPRGGAAPEAPPLLEAVRAGDKKAVARLFNQLEDRRPERVRETAAALDELYRGSLERSHVVGVTGPPGAGKSCLVSRLMAEARSRGMTVGVIAIDPSSRRSRGAILGDRLRLDFDAADAGIFVRSMANRGDLGGVSDRTFAGTIVLRSAFDLVIVETVGVGQAESDVRDLSDTTVFVIQPGSGDMIQFIKAGIMEEPDLMVVNKGDQPQARRTLNDVRSALHTNAGEGVAWQPKALLASALSGEGVAEVFGEVLRRREYLNAEGRLVAGRRTQAADWLVNETERLHGVRGIEALGGREALRERCRRETSAGPFEALERISGSIRIDAEGGEAV